MSTWEDKILDKLTVNNIIALFITGLFGAVILQMTFNAKSLLIIMEENTEWVVTGAFVFGVLAAKFSDIIQFYFRKEQSA